MKSFIVEGPDNAGKSTLVSALAKALQMEVKHQVKPETIEEFKDAVKFEVESSNVIFDRGMAISQAMYDIALNRKALMDDSVLINYVELELRTMPVIVCLPPAEQVLRAPADRPEMTGVVANRAEIYGAYEGFLESAKDYNNVVVYDYMQHSVEDAVEWLINAMGISDVQ